MVNIKQSTAYLLITLLLTACSQLPHSSTEVEQRDLLRSMVYTQRHLIELELGDQPIKDTRQWQLMIESHCDLIKRDFVYAKKAPAQCRVATEGKAQFCIAAFHRCIGQCTSFKQECRRCEQQATECLSTEN